MRLGVVLLVILLAGCAPRQHVVILAPPSGYLEPCELPAVPHVNEGLSVAFVQAHMCATMHERDKRRIREWIEEQRARL
jgi:hypothetical protein